MLFLLGLSWNNSFFRTSICMNVLGRCMLKVMLLLKGTTISVAHSNLLLLIKITFSAAMLLRFLKRICAFYNLFLHILQSVIFTIHSWGMHDAHKMAK